MGVDLESIPTTNTIDLRINFLNNGQVQGSLNVGQASTESFRFDSIGVGSAPPFSVYHQETPGNISISPPNLAFVDYSVERKLVLRYGISGGTQQNIVFALP